MEIGAFGLLLIIGLGIIWTESTKTGAKFINWVGKTFCDTDSANWED